jgi:transcriptional regulator with XRE-family HTH domain
MEVLEKIEKLRKEKGWSINYLAMESGLTQSTLNNLYSRNTEPKISTLRAICGAFGITLSDFFKEEEKDDELVRRVKTLSKENKTALLQILKNGNENNVTSYLFFKSSYNSKPNWPFPKTAIFI